MLEKFLKSAKARIESRDRARATARANVRTMLADGYRFATCTDTFNADRFFADRLCEFSPSEMIAGFVDVFKPDQLRATRPKPEYLIVAIRDLETGNLRYICTCPFWRGEWFTSHPQPIARRGWCKHTECLELLVACSLPICDLVASLLDSRTRESQHAARDRTRPASVERTHEAELPRRSTTLRAVGFGRLAGDGYGTWWIDPPRSPTSEERA